ncbi:ArsR family transcriptional regulator [Thermococcus siculi]|uniref:ArsR family transcriptional regulator n=1 Tax=Thermococcus siculi TaxID=72803 RepID=A0A2Z2ML28_9EURY|nr:ATP-binding protein [Thermococcus siculi]ASJ08508.1 ArsR family transcriptional regulator [Thermococcus siculi]
MIMHKFVNRREELSRLREAFRRNALVVVYGRRRVGKTRLLVEAAKEVPHIYHLCKEEEVSETLKSLSLKLFHITRDERFVKRPLSSFEEFFEALPSGSVLILDEFQVLVRNYPRILGILQEYLDFHQGNPIVLCGSSVSMMEELTQYGSPIYGRRGLALKVEPLSFFHVREFFPGYSPEDLVKTYAVLGGIPEYLLRFDPSLSPEENIRREFFGRGFLYGEAEFLLRYELRDLSTYNTILEALSYGYRSFGELRNATGIDGSKLPRYLSVLIELGIVRKEVPITLKGRDKGRRRNARYSIGDNYFSFYYSFVYPFKEEIELGFLDAPLENFGKGFNRYLGFAFEGIAKQFLIELNKSGKLPFRFTRIGRWWHKGEEIDLVALNERERKALFVEVKWKELSEREARGILKDLERKAELVGFKGGERYHGLVAKEIEGKEALREEGWLVWDLRDFEGLTEG